MAEGCTDPLMNYDPNIVIDDSSWLSSDICT